jgi:flagellar secretion chaperone FliS
MNAPQAAFKKNAANAYAKIGLETAVESASPHELITMLFNGAKATIAMARLYMADNDIQGKGNAISKAINIVQNGLKAGLVADAAGPEGAELVTNLTALYDYITQRLMYANLHNDPAMLDEADQLLDNIGSAWREIGTSNKQSVVSPHHP